MHVLVEQLLISHEYLHKMSEAQVDLKKQAPAPEKEEQQPEKGLSDDAYVLNGWHHCLVR